MRSAQDRIPTHRLSANEMALDSQGRVLHRPYFVTKEEHEQALIDERRGWARMMAIERERTRAAELKVTELSETPPRIEVISTVWPKIRARKRLHWVLRGIAKIE